MIIQFIFWAPLAILILLIIAAIYAYHKENAVNKPPAKGFTKINVKAQTADMLTVMILGITSRIKENDMNFSDKEAVALALSALALTEILKNKKQIWVATVPEPSVPEKDGETA